MSISIYDPNVTHAPIYYPRNGSKPYLRYNHCVDVIPAGDGFLAAWNANATPKEGAPRQYNYFSRSSDFRTWSPHERLFSAPYSDPPVESGNQWQPSFLNFHDRKLFVMWADFTARKSYISHSPDGRRWRTEETSPLPEGLTDTVAFPTNHGLLTRDNVMYFPVSFPPIDGAGGVGNCRHAGCIFSRNGGESWEWGGVTSAAGDLLLWEPMIFEKADGSLGMLIRNSGPAEKFKMPPTEQTILFAESPDRGKTWTKCIPLDLESVVTRCFAAAFGPGGDSLLMVMNDFQPGIRPEEGPEDRLMLSLYFAPTTDPELLMPAVLVQPPGGRAFYPNGFVKDGKLYCAYTYPDYIMASVVHELPDFTRDFLAVRGGRNGAGCVPGENRLVLSQPGGTIPLFLSTRHTRQDSVVLQFRFHTRFRSEFEFPLLTLGGKSSRGGALLLRFREGEPDDELFFRACDDNEVRLGAVPPDMPCGLSLTCDGTGLTIRFSNREFKIAGTFLRKFAFGGLYVAPEWPLGVQPVRDEIEIEYDSILVQ